jgi:RNA recognition motif-containing protein
VVRENSDRNSSHEKEDVMNIYVGNLALNVTEDDLQQAFQAFGEVETVKIIKDRYSGESRGFAFVEMPAGAEAQSAINDLNGKELKGLQIKVNQAKPQSNKRKGFRQVLIFLKSSFRQKYSIKKQKILYSAHLFTPKSAVNFKILSNQCFSSCNQNTPSYAMWYWSFCG